ncbi:hypothetical protein [Sphingobium sp.]|uniref:hypothetical protein n=1 Tax=Sphingobium sp. TaxID=1912891 RepID=UPI002632A8DE|nr:hypothetical protein [Sphingobium sp.]
MSDARDEQHIDLLTGIAAIAKHLNWPERRVLHQHEKGLIPTFKQGRLVCARRSTLAKHFEAQERAAREGGE